MEQSFILKQYGKIDLNDQYSMIGEDRIWWIKRLEKDAEDKRKHQSGNGPSHTPGILPL